jgi:AcrR family transcriptional regulator
MSRRSAATAETRRRIIEATRALHNEQGIMATSWDDIAKRARVGIGTVYRHFPSLDELVPACGEISMRNLELPSERDIPQLFTALEGTARVDRLVELTFAIAVHRARRHRARRSPRRADVRDLRTRSE